MNWRGCGWNRKWPDWDTTPVFTDMTRGNCDEAQSEQALWVGELNPDLLNTRQERSICQCVRLVRGNPPYGGPWRRCKQREVKLAGQEDDLLGCVYLLVINRFDYAMLKHVCLNVTHHVMSSRTYLQLSPYLHVLHYVVVQLKRVFTVLDVLGSIVVQLLCLHLSAYLNVLYYVVVQLIRVFAVFRCSGFLRGTADTCLHLSACSNVLYYVMPNCYMSSPISMFESSAYVMTQLICVVTSHRV
jgi:hypothetical protein